jgi:hypothetical protein
MGTVLFQNILISHPFLYPSPLVAALYRNKTRGATLYDTGIVVTVIIIINHTIITLVKVSTAQ